MLIQRISFLQGLCLLCLIWVAVYFVINPRVPQVNTPDFKEITSISERKQAFFEFFRPLIEAENAKILALRDALQHHPKQALVAKLASQYNVMLDNPRSEDDIKNLLAHVDIVPASLALAQAAMESAWGTSRFATEGNNYFGQWCYTKGCGLVPTQRNAGATHEVQAFVSPANSVAAYMRNINRHNSYRTLRTLRAKARTSQQPIYGCTLANGLGNYSERGQAYVDEIKQMIRINGLSESIDAPC